MVVPLTVRSCSTFKPLMRLIFLKKSQWLQLHTKSEKCIQTSRSRGLLGVSVGPVGMIEYPKTCSIKRSLGLTVWTPPSCFLSSLHLLLTNRSCQGHSVRTQWNRNTLLRIFYQGLRVHHLIKWYFIGQSYKVSAKEKKKRVKDVRTSSVWDVCAVKSGAFLPVENVWVPQQVHGAESVSTHNREDEVQEHAHPSLPAESLLNLPLSPTARLRTTCSLAR